MPQCFAVGILGSVAKHRSTERRERIPDSDAVQELGDGSATCEMTRMFGEESTSVLDLIEGEWETREIYLAGGRLNPSESLAVAP